jgi:hypothetical protein
MEGKGLVVGLSVGTREGRPLEDGSEVGTEGAAVGTELAFAEEELVVALREEASKDLLCPEDCDDASSCDT